jgi:hypothetical protein
LATNPDDIVAQARGQFNRLMEYSEQMDSNRSFLELEACVLKQALEIGRLAMEAHLACQSPLHKHATACDRDGVERRYHSERRGSCQTICGVVPFLRSYYWGEGSGHCEMDAALNLAPNGPSDFLRMLKERLSNSMAYEDASKFLADYFPVSKSTRCIQELFSTDCQETQAYYEQCPIPMIDAQETILVVQADCKGVPMVLGSCVATQGSIDAHLPGKKKSGPKREGKKKMATVVTVATYAPLARTGEQIVSSLFDDKTYIPAPKGHSFKKVWATMKGKDAAIGQSQTFVKQAMSPTTEHRVLLTDGERALKDRVRSAYPGFTHVLDLIHVMSYLWLGAGAQFGANTAAEKAWVRGATLRLLRGEADTVVEELYVWAEAAKAPNGGCANPTAKAPNGGCANPTAKAPSKYQPLEKAAWYLDGNLGSMRYDEYLANGWPIATGMVEGACRHVVKDRCERSGQRWTEEGVEGMLRLRCVEENGDWEAYHAYRIRTRQETFYRRNPQPQIDEGKTDVYRFNTEIKWAEAA